MGEGFELDIESELEGLAEREEKREERPIRRDYVEWVGNGYGIFYFEYPRMPTDVVIKNMVDLKIWRRHFREVERRLEGRILIRIVPRKEITYPPEPAWITALRLQMPELPKKTMLGYLVVPISEFVKFKTEEITEGVQEVKKGVFKLIINKSIDDILRENKIIIEIPYELDMEHLRDVLKKHEIIQIRGISVQELLRMNVLSISWTIIDLSEEVFKRGLQMEFQRIEALAIEGALSPRQFIERITDVKESFSRLSDYVIIAVSIKNETLGTILQSTVSIEKIEIVFPETVFGIDDIIVPDKLRGLTNIKPSEGKIEIAGLRLELNQELSFALGVRQRVLSRAVSSSERGLKIRIIGRLEDPSPEIRVPDIITGIMFRTNKTYSYGLVYFTPMGYPVTTTGMGFFIPPQIDKYPLPDTRTELRIDLEEILPIEIQLREPVKREIPLAKTEFTVAVKTLKKILESLGFAPLYDSDVKVVRFAEPWDRIVSLEYLLYKGIVDGIPTVLFVEVYGITKTVSITTEGRSEAGKSIVSERRLLSDIKISIRTSVPPSMIPKLMEIFDGIRDRLESVGR